MKLKSFYIVVGNGVCYNSQVLGEEEDFFIFFKAALTQDSKNKNPKWG
jgi:hypothetical protein